MAYSHIGPITVELLELAIHNICVYNTYGDTMKKITQIMLCSILLMTISPFSVFSGGKTIYGEDNRIDYFRASSNMQERADSVVSLWRSHRAKFDEKTNSYNLVTQNFGEDHYLVENEPFREQNEGAFCSGALVADDIIMTAGHCVPTNYICKGLRFVFGFAVKEAGGKAPLNISANEVYSCKELITQIEPLITSLNPSGITPDNPTAMDYALIRLNRKVTGHKPLPVNRKSDLKKGDGVFIIGHPMGLPVKIAGDSTVRDNSPESHFVADLDSYSGNSGSPVFNAQTKLIEGILVRGDKNFVETLEGLNASYTVAQDAGRGSDVTRVSLVSSFIPKIEDRTETTYVEIYVEEFYIQTLGNTSDFVNEIFKKMPF